MLKGISKLLNGELLKQLCDMGHGDMLAIVDANYPAFTMGKKVIAYPGICATELLRALIDVFSLDHISDKSVLLMDMESRDIEQGMCEPEIWSDFIEIIRAAYGTEKVVGKISRQKFYEMSKDAFIIIQTGEERLYGNLILIKGVINF